jgi:hypothetical protein
MDHAMKTLGAILREADALNWRHALYMPFGETWNEATACAVLDPEESEQLDDAPPLAKEYGLKYALGISTLQGIVANARLQEPSVDTTDLLKALLFYYDHDAFIVFPSR